MEVILLDKIAKLGGLGDKVTVKSGYARNFLLPKGKAVFASDANVEHFEARGAEIEAKLAETLKAAEAKAAKVVELAEVTIASSAGDEGKLFGSVGTNDIANAITNAGVDVSKSEVRLSDGAFHAVGEYEVGIHLHSDVDVIVTIAIVASEG